MERRVFFINEYTEYLGVNHSPEEFEDGFITIKNPGNSLDVIVEGFNRIIKEGWTVISFIRNIDESYSKCIFYAAKQPNQPKQQLIRGEFICPEESVREINQLLAQGWHVKDSWESYILLELDQEDVISSEQKYLDRIKEIIAEKGRLRTSDLAELDALRKKLGISKSRAEEIESYI